jgi:hypothetical protein
VEEKLPAAVDSQSQPRRAEAWPGAGAEVWHTGVVRTRLAAVVVRESEGTTVDSGGTKDGHGG